MRALPFIAFLVAFPAVAAEPTPPAPAAPPAFDVASIDKTQDPCNDFFAYACGGWDKTHEIPADQPKWSRFNELDDANKLRLRDILEAAAKADKRDPDTQKIGDTYQSCMDEAAVDKAGAKPLAATLKRIDKLADKGALAREIARQHRDSGSAVLFDFEVEQDPANAQMMFAVADQGGIGLQDRGC